MLAPPSRMLRFKIEFILIDAEHFRVHVFHSIWDVLFVVTTHSKDPPHLIRRSKLMNILQSMFSIQFEMY